MLKRQDAASTGHAPVERPGGEVVFGNITRICYNAFNAPVTVTDANGIVTDYSYNDAGCVTRIVRRDGSEVLSPAGPVSSKGTSYPAGRSLGVVWFNDLLGTTVGAKSGNRYSAAALSAFGEDLNLHCPPPPTFSTLSSFYTGKPHVAGLGHVFLMRNYRAGLAKCQTADPMGYPENAPQKLCFGGKPRAQRSARRARKGPRWNQLAYCGNGVTGSVDLWGCVSLNGCVIPSNDLPMVKGAFAPDFGIGFSVAVKWTCDHDFDNPSITAEISVAEDSVAGPIFVFYKGDEFAFVQFDYIAKEDTAILINSDSMFQDLKKLRVTSCFGCRSTCDLL